MSFSHLECGAGVGFDCIDAYSLTIRINHNRRTVLERSEINTCGGRWGGGLNRFYERSTSLWILLWFMYKYKMCSPREGLVLIIQNSEHINQDSSLR